MKQLHCPPASFWASPWWYRGLVGVRLSCGTLGATFLGPWGLPECSWSLREGEGSREMNPGPHPCHPFSGQPRQRIAWPSLRRVG